MKIYRRKKTQNTALGRSFDLLIQDASNRLMAPDRTHTNNNFNDDFSYEESVAKNPPEVKNNFSSVFDVIDDDGNNGQYSAYKHNRQTRKKLKKSLSECKGLDLISTTKTQSSLCGMNSGKNAYKTDKASTRNAQNPDCFLLAKNEFTSNVSVKRNSLLVRSCSEGANAKYTGPRKIFSGDTKKRKAVCQLSSFFDQDKAEELKREDFKEKLPVLLSSKPDIPIVKRKKLRDETKVSCQKEDKMLFTVISNVRQAYKCEELGEVQGFLDDWDYNVSGFKATDNLSTKIHCALQLVKHCALTEFRNELRSEKVVKQLFELFTSKKENVALQLHFLFILWNLARDESHFILEDCWARYLINLLITTEENNVCNMHMDFDYYVDTIDTLKDLANKLVPARVYKPYFILDFSMESLLLETLSIMLRRCADKLLSDEALADDLFCHLKFKFRKFAQNFFIMSHNGRVGTGLFKLSRCLHIMSTFLQHHDQNVYPFFFDIEDDDVLLSFETTINAGLNWISSFCLESSDTAMIIDILRSCYSLLVDITTDNELISRRFAESVLFVPSVIILSKIDQNPFISDKFEMLILILAMILNMVQYSHSLRKRIIVGFNDSNNHGQVLLILVEMYKRREDSALKAESQEENQWMSFYEIVSADKNNEKINRALQKADKHMEDSILASYAAMIIGTLVENNTISVDKIMEYDLSFDDFLTSIGLWEHKFVCKENYYILKRLIDEESIHVMISLLKKVYTFMEISIIKKATSITGTLLLQEEKNLSFMNSRE